MPNFFVPFAESSEQAARVYDVFLKQNPYPPQSGRLFRISFLDRKRWLVAEVGKEIVGWSEKDGPVLAIIEGENLVTIHTQLRGGLSATPILVSPDEVDERVYFDDFPAHS
jgi:hypothetical protein